jgi:uncharacterized membrane protein
MPADPELRPDRRRERGNVLFVSAAALLFLLSVAVIAVDTGRIGWQKRQLRLQTDLAALAAGWEVGDCRGGASDPVAAANAAGAANGYEGDLSQAPNGVRLGRVETVSGVRTFVATGDAASARAVEVVAVHDVPRSWLLPTLIPGTVALSARATARPQAVAGIRVGSRAASVSEDDADVLDQVLGGLLGGALDVSAVGYDGLLDAQLTLGDLVAAAGVGDVEQLLAAELSVADFLDATASALSAGGESAAAATLDDVVASIPGGQTFSVGDVLEVAEGGDEAALDASLNAFDLLGFSAQAANLDHAVVIDPLTLDLPGVAAGTLELVVIEPPQIAVGPPGRDEEGEWRTRATTGQIRFQLELEALDDLDIGVLSGAVRLGLAYEVAPAEARLAWIECARAARPVHRVGVEVEPGLVRYGFGSFTDIEASDTIEPLVVTELRFLGTPVARVSASSELAAVAAPTELVFDGPFPPERTQSVGGSLGGSAAAAQEDIVQETEFDVEVLGSLPVGVTVGAIADAVAGAVAPVITDASAALTSILTGVNGHAGDADVSVLTVSQAGPRLVR